MAPPHYLGHFQRLARDVPDELKSSQKIEHLHDAIKDVSPDATHDVPGRQFEWGSNEYDVSYYRLPDTNGKWEGKEGESIWRPDREWVPSNPLTNPDGKTMGEILDGHGIDGIEFNNNDPDFSPVSEGTVEIDDFSVDRDSNYEQADTKLAEQWNVDVKDGRTNWTSDEIAQYRKENALSWHERKDMKSMDLVPTDVHGNIPHDGGIAAAKAELRA